MFANVTHRNEYSRCCACGSMCNAEVLAKSHDHQEELKSTDEKEILHCQDALSTKNYCKKQRYTDEVQKHITKHSTSKAERTSMKIRGIYCAPLLAGQVQVGKVTNDQRVLLIEELHVRGIVVSAKKLIAKMKSVLIDYEHPNPKNEEVKKNFNPKLFAAADWSKDALASSLQKLNTTRSSRSQCDIVVC